MIHSETKKKTSEDGQKNDNSANNNIQTSKFPFVPPLTIC
jgi:hypothetical protein